MRIALGVEYNGQDFFGWQAQENLVTVQGCLESAVSQIANEPVKLFCAGRTDAGVHATGQVVHFDTNAERNTRAWTLGVNTHLPSSISVSWAEAVDDEFHARFSAIARCYRYIIYNQSIRSAHLAKRATWHYPPLDSHKMKTAGQFLLGEQDFSSFRSSECQSHSPMRNVHSLDVQRNEQFVIVSIQANAFLHHMVRNIVGVLLRIGAGFHSVEWMEEVLHAKDRRNAAETASPDGLYLERVIYPEKYLLPASRNSLFFF